MEWKGCESIIHDHDCDLWVTMVGWVDVPYSDWGDFKHRRAVDISSLILMRDINFAWQHQSPGGGVLPMWWVIHMCRGFDPLFSLLQDRARSFWGIFSSTNSKAIFWGTKTTNFYKNRSFWPQIQFFPRSFWVQFSAASGTPPSVFKPSTPPPGPIHYLNQCSLIIKHVLWQSLGPWFDIKMLCYHHTSKKFHCGDTTVVRSSYLHSEISCTGKMASLYWISPLKAISQEVLMTLIHNHVFRDYTFKINLPGVNELNKNT